MKYTGKCTAMTELKIKGFPKSFSNADKRDFLLYFEAKDAFIQNDFCIATFHNAGQAQEFLTKLHQKEILDSRLNIQIYTPSKLLHHERLQVEAEPSTSKLDPLLEKLCAINPHLKFSDPPDPTLKYKYPKPNREIIDSICVALESVPKFYTQVLHLMNRMNLPPPFLPSHLKKTTFTSTGSQTEISNIKGRDRILKDDLHSGESEIDSDDDDEQTTHQNIPDTLKKRKSVMNLKNPSKRFATSIQKHKSTKPPLAVNEVFEQVQLSTKIVVQMPQNLPREEQTTREEKPKEQHIETFTDIDFTNRLPQDQMKILPVFKDYSPGEPTNKLYIKNLSKTVTEEDLKMVYGRFVKKDLAEIEIKLMQSGRMKGQAFLVFNTPYDEEDAETGIERMIDKALRETNGLILKDKPIVVVYGKVQKK